MIKLYCYTSDTDSKAIIAALKGLPEDIRYSIMSLQARQVKPYLVDEDHPGQKWVGKQECLAYIAGIHKGHRE